MTVTVNGTADDDATMSAPSMAPWVTVRRLPCDGLHADTERRADRQWLATAMTPIDASGLTATAIGLTIDGGDGNDVIIGSQGADTLSAATATTSDRWARQRHALPWHR